MFTDAIKTIWESSGFAALTWQHLVMIAVACVLIYLAIAKKFEPMLLLPIAFGVLLVNLPLTGLMSEPITSSDSGGLLYYLYLGVKKGIYPSLIFLGIGAMTDFGPLIARPTSLFIGAGAQLGIAIAFLMATALGFVPQAAASIAIIGQSSVSVNPVELSVKISELVHQILIFTLAGTLAAVEPFVIRRPVQV